ncbi:GIY-YIG nuclease family protein [Belliella kenyensis]|uniref:GIY-YIG nuclease family protein n=1 Tax=Belliella kenyensis TaxID=1472724 RepID=A0ABV8EPJ8_9BACT|nr:GIY-YIG nuclease family protein [Belliella kenyensis]MCH7402489.1 GIY-YIG nuclease family protein [Belliella kenyensis]MDN3603288.1 GIY-YIG nuclease family protein [Belliella kenyensis]
MDDVYYTYVLKSRDYDYFYKGHCKDLQKRLAQHNAGMTKSIKPFIPFDIVYFEEFKTLEEAIKREKYFKSSRGRKFLNKILDA